LKILVNFPMSFQENAPFLPIISCTPHIVVTQCLSTILLWRPPLPRLSNSFLWLLATLFVQKNLAVLTSRHLSWHVRGGMNSE
jgi:hypothetical protein